jgi:predicted Fe-Mo cluster-binding NifX family protein
MKKDIELIDDEISKLEKLKMDILRERKGGKNMKIAVSSSGKELDSQIDARFGRCPYFVIVDIENKEIKGSEAIENTSAVQMGGAGITAAQLVADRGVKTVITGNMGPRAFSVFEQLDIEVYQGTGTVKEAVEKLTKGELAKIGGPTGPMFMGGGSGTGPGTGRDMGRGMGRGRRQQ